MPRDMRATKVAAAPDDVEKPLEDRISTLPDAILQHVLGFLPADEAVTTCVLARHWRHQWRSVRRLRINCDMPDVVKLVNRLLLLRTPGMALDEFEVSNNFLGLVHPEIAEEVHVWIRHALMCKAQVLTIYLPITLDPLALISQYLTRLKTTGVDFRAGCLDFVTCPALEVLDIIVGHLSCLRILSQSVKHLRIINTRFAGETRACISMPSLISLKLKNFRAKAPVLEFMPSLQTAFVGPDRRGKRDACMQKGDSRYDNCGYCAYCCGWDDHRGRCVLLGGLSNAMYLELIAYSGTFIFKRDLRWCPTFSKLKTLLLNEWCVAVDFSALVCILEHSPVLEKLTIQISQDTKCKSELEGRNNKMQREPQVSEHLKIVEIKCENVGFQVFKILSFLSTFVMQVNVIRVTRESNLFSFEN